MVRTTRKTEDSTPERTPAEQEREDKRKLNEEHGFAAQGTESDPYGRTNHAMTADEVAANALREGSLRPDGRPKAGIYADDVLRAEQDRQREYIENQQWNDDGTPVDQAAIAANQHPVVAERGEPLTASVVVTTPEELEKANALAQPVDGKDAENK